HTERDRRTRVVRQRDVLFDLELPRRAPRHPLRQSADPSRRRTSAAGAAVADDVRDGVAGARLPRVAGAAGGAPGRRPAPPRRPPRRRRVDVTARAVGAARGAADAAVRRVPRAREARERAARSSRAISSRERRAPRTHQLERGSLEGRLREIGGIVANYVYDVAAIDTNRETYASTHNVMAAPSV